eukprot:5845526-Amphidinium_carterae.1
MGSTTWVSSYFGSPGSSSMWAGTSLSDADFASDLALRLLGRRSRVVEVCPPARQNCQLSPST